MRLIASRRIASLALAGILVLGGCSPSVTPAPTSHAPDATDAGSAPPPSTPATGGADIVLRGGHVLTMDPARPVAEAVVIDGDRIVAVGSDAELDVLIGPATHVFDLGGMTVVPGFIDAHAHRIVNGPNVLGLDAADIVRDAVEQGYTTIDELYVDPSWVGTFASLDEAGELPLHVNAYLTVNENSAEGVSFGAWFDTYRPGDRMSPNVRVAGLKIFTDFDNAQILLWEQADLDAFVLARYRDGWQLALKTVDARSLDMILTAVGRAAEADPSIDVAGTRVEHMLFATPDQIATLGELGITPIINLNIPGQVVGDASIDELISRNPDGSYVPWRSLFEAGIEPAGMSGFPTAYVDEPTGAPFGSPLHLIWQAITRAGNLGVRSPEELLGQAITAEQALRSLTINAAIASGEGSEKGSIEPGKLADIVVLTADPLAVETEAINDIGTLMTIVAGRVEWCAPELRSTCPAASGGQPSAAPGPAELE